MDVADFTLSLRQLDRWFAGQLTKRPRPSGCRVMEAEFGHSVDILLARESEAPSLASAAAASTRKLQTTEFVAWIADHSGWAFTDVYTAVANAADRRAAQSFAARAAAEHAGASRGRAELAAAVRSYYGGSQGFCTTSIGGTTLSLSMLIEPTRLDLQIPLDRDHQQFRLERSPTVVSSTRPTSLGAEAAIERLGSVEAGDTIVLDNPIYQLLSLDPSAHHLRGRLALSTFAAYALTCDLLEGELFDALGPAPSQRGRDLFRSETCIYRLGPRPSRSTNEYAPEGPPGLLAIARPDD